MVAGAVKHMELDTVLGNFERVAERYNHGLTFVKDGSRKDGDREVTVSYPELLTRGQGVAAAFQARGLRAGDRVAVVLPDPEAFVTTFVGLLCAGAVPVPMYPPLGVGQLSGYLEHARHIVGTAHCTYLVTTSDIRAVLGTLGTSVPGLRGLLTVEELRAGIDASAYVRPDVAADDTCFIQFTSGSTANPKGVEVTQGNLVHNGRAIQLEGLNVDPDVDRGVSWLPLFHDMGLIGFLLSPIQLGIPVTLMSPMRFLRRPMTWLETITKHQATMTYGPNFAYGLAAKRAREKDIESLDLSRLRGAGCGAEPIQANTLRRFAQVFGPCGFDEKAFVCSYGMAESTLAISFAWGIPTDTVESESLWSEGVAKPVTVADAEVALESAESSGESSAGLPPGVLEIVGCGGAFKHHEIRIVGGGGEGVEVGERQVGEIQVRGPSVMAGYFELPDKTAETVLEGGWLRSGDLGYMADGNLFICGRAKDVIILHGKNYYPQDLEWAANQVPRVRTGNVVVFSAHKPNLDREAVVVVAETRESDDRDGIASEIRQTIQSQVGLTVDDVTLVEAGVLPKTSSGKVQRRRTRALWEEGGLHRSQGDGKLKVAAQLVESQLAHLKLRIFGR